MRRRECDALGHVARTLQYLETHAPPLGELHRLQGRLASRLEGEAVPGAALARLRHGGKMRNTSAPLRPPRRRRSPTRAPSLPKRHEEGGATGYEAAHFSARRRRRLGRPSISTGLRTASPQGIQYDATKRGQAEVQGLKGGAAVQVWRRRLF